MMSQLPNKATLFLACTSFLALAGIVGMRSSATAPYTPLLAPNIARPATPVSAPILPILARTNLDPNKVELGARLFQDKRLSRDGSISCASCHDLHTAGSDGRARSLNVDGKPGRLNAPMIFNSGLNFRQFWDGRAATLEEQVDASVRDLDQLGTTWPLLLERIHQDPSYLRDFQSAYGQAPGRANVEHALAEFERALVTPGSAFDRYLQGDPTAISDEAESGYLCFLELGCGACHQGVNVGGNMFQQMGSLESFFDTEREISSADNGRFNVTGREQDRFKFRVPSLRNIEKSAPYFHDGSAPTLEAAVALMGRHQLGIELKAAELASIIAFLQTLSAELPQGVKVHIQ